MYSSNYVTNIKIMVESRYSYIDIQFIARWIEVSGSELNEFHTNLPFADNVRECSLNISRLACVCQLNGQITMPRTVCSSSLTFLNLRSVPWDYDWGCFGPSYRLVEFLNLRTLMISSYPKEIDKAIG